MWIYLGPGARPEPSHDIITSPLVDLDALADEFPHLQYMGIAQRDKLQGFLISLDSSMARQLTFRYHPHIPVNAPLDHDLVDKLENFSLAPSP